MEELAFGARLGAALGAILPFRGIIMRAQEREGWGTLAAIYIPWFLWIYWLWWG